MSKTLAYRLFRVGGIPDQLRAQLEVEGVLLQDEGIPVSVTYKHFRRPRVRASWRRISYSGSLTITQTRVVGLGGSSPLVNVPFTDSRLRQINMSVEPPDMLLMTLDASLFHDDWSGTIEYRFRTPHAQMFLETLMTQMTRQPL